MRKHLLVVAACGLTLPALAQTERGNKLLGVSLGDLQYSSASKGNNSVSASLYPTVGFFLADNFALGTKLNLSYARRKYSYPNGREQSVRYLDYGLAPFARYYVLGTGRHQVFGEAGVSYERHNYRNFTQEPPGIGGESEQKQQTNVWSYHAAAGYNFFLTPNAALEATVGYRRFPEDNYDFRRSAVDVRVGFSVFLGGSSAAE